jgi:hypothetical protein
MPEKGKIESNFHTFDKGFKKHYFWGYNIFNY